MKYRVYLDHKYIILKLPDHLDYSPIINYHHCFDQLQYGIKVSDLKILSYKEEKDIETVKFIYSFYLNPWYPKNPSIQHILRCIEKHIPFIKILDNFEFSEPSNYFEVDLDPELVKEYITRSYESIKNYTFLDVTMLLSNREPAKFSTNLVWYYRKYITKEID